MSRYRPHHTTSSASLEPAWFAWLNLARRNVVCVTHSIVAKKATDGLREAPMGAQVHLRRTREERNP